MARALGGPYNRVSHHCPDLSTHFLYPLNRSQGGICAPMDRSATNRLSTADHPPSGRPKKAPEMLEPRTRMLRVISSLAGWLLSRSDFRKDS